MPYDSERETCEDRRMEGVSVGGEAHLLVVPPLSIPVPHLDPQPPLPRRRAVPPRRQEHLGLPRAALLPDERGRAGRRLGLDMRRDVRREGRRGRDRVDVREGEATRVHVERGAEGDAGRLAGVRTLAARRHVHTSVSSGPNRHGTSHRRARRCDDAPAPRRAPARPR